MELAVTYRGGAWTSITVDVAREEPGEDEVELVPAYTSLRAPSVARSTNPGSGRHGEGAGPVSLASEWAILYRYRAHHRSRPPPRSPGPARRRHLPGSLLAPARAGRTRCTGRARGGRGAGRERGGHCVPVDAGCVRPDRRRGQRARR